MGSAAFLRGIGRGFVRDLDHEGHALGGDDVTGAIGKLRVVLSPRSELLISGDMIHQDPIPLTYAKVLAVKPGFQVDNPADLHEVRASTLAQSRNLQHGAAVRLTMRPTPDTTLTSLTAFRKLDYDVLADTDITELDLTASRIHEMHHQWSEEVAISQQRPTWTWIGGLFLFGDVDRQPTSVRLGGPRLENRLDPKVESNSGAIFGQGTIRVGPRVSATAGLRYTRERKAIENAGRLYALDPPADPIPGSAFAYTDAISHPAWTPKVGLEARTGTQTLTYISATRGSRAAASTSRRRNQAGGSRPNGPGATKRA